MGGPRPINIQPARDRSTRPARENLSIKRKWMEMKSKDDKVRWFETEAIGIIPNSYQKASNSILRDSNVRAYRSHILQTGISGDGRCLFRAVVHGACLGSGKPAPSDVLEKELADELRENVANELMKRRLNTERFIEGDFGQYVRHMRQPHVWGGEPELLMSSHVLQMPISVYMRDKNSGNLKLIAEYGQEYGKDNPIRVLFHSYGHYDLLQVPGN